MSRVKELLLAAALAGPGCAPPSESCAEGACSADTREPAGVRAAAALPSAAKPGFCGDGVWNPEREECDDGSACRDGRDCTSDRLRCQATSASACQPRSSDGCSDQCRLEPGYLCVAGTDCRPAIDSCSADTAAASACAARSEPATGAPSLSGPDRSTSPTDAGAQPSAPSAPLSQIPVTGEPLAPPGRGEPCRSWRFDPAEPISGLDPELDHRAPALASDGRTLFFAVSAPGAVERIFFAVRSGRSSAFSSSAEVGNIGSESGEGTPFPTFDGLSLFFYSGRPEGVGDRDIWFATRPDPAAAFGTPLLLPFANSDSLDHLPWLTADGLTLLFVSTRAGSSGAQKVWLARRDSRAQSFGTPEPYAALGSPAQEGRTTASSDGTSLFFSSDRDGGQGGQDLWLALLGDDGIASETPTNLRELNTQSHELDPFFSVDERELFFASNRGGPWRLFRSLVECDD